MILFENKNLSTHILDNVKMWKRESRKHEVGRDWWGWVGNLCFSFTVNQITSSKPHFFWMSLLAFKTNPCIADAFFIFKALRVKKKKKSGTGWGKLCRVTLYDKLYHLFWMKALKLLRRMSCSSPSYGEREVASCRNFWPVKSCIYVDL